jgi:hypothetical protein
MPRNTAREKTNMATKSEQKFVVKKVKAGRGENAKSFYMEVGRLTIRETDKGISGTLYLHHLDGDFAVFPVEKKPDAEAQE